MQKIILLAIIACVLPQSVLAAKLPQYVWHPATERFQATSNYADAIRALNNPNTVGTFLKDTVQWIPQKSSSYPPVSSPVVQVVAGAGAGKALMRKGMGVVVPIAGVASTLMMMKDIYDWANASPENKAHFDGVANDAPLEDLLNANQMPIVNNTYSYGSGYVKVTATQLLNSNYQALSDPADQVFSTKVTTWFGPYGTGSYGGDWKVYKQYNIFYTQVGSPSAPPNLASQPFDTFQSEITEYVETGSNPEYPGLEGGIDEAFSDNADSPMVQIAPTPSDFKKAAAEQTAVDTSQKAQETLEQQQQTVQSQYSSIKVRFTAGLASQSELDEITRIKESLDAQTAQNEADKAAVLPESLPDELKTIDWSPFQSLVGVLVTKFPFNVLDGLKTSYDHLVAEPYPPVFDFVLAQGNHVSVDLTPWDPFAKITRFLIASITTVGAALYVVRFWRGVS